MVVLFIVITIGLIVGFYFFLYKPKVDAINQMKAQRQTKESQLRGYIKEVMDLMNYEDQLDILSKKWDENKHFYVLGKPKEGMKPQEYQFAIFDAYDAIFQMGAYDLCLQEMGIIRDKKLDGYLVINLKKDGTMDTQMATDMELNCQAFKNALGLYKIINSLK